MQSNGKIPKPLSKGAQIVERKIWLTVLAVVACGFTKIVIEWSDNSIFIDLMLNRKLIIILHTLHSWYVAEMTVLLYFHTITP